MARSKSQIRNLAQYKDLPDDEFEQLWLERNQPAVDPQEFEDRIKKKIEEFSQDYDIDDLKINDKESLRALVQAVIALEDYEKISYDLRSTDAISQTNVNIVDRISKVMSDLRKDISKLQEDLAITRKVRKTDKESSVVSYISALKDQAKEYYESKACYVFCPSCNMLLATLWTLYPDSHNKLELKCDRTLDDGHKCGTKVTVTTKELWENKGTNKREIIPEAML